MFHVKHGGYTVADVLNVSRETPDVETLWKNLIT